MKIFHASLAFTCLLLLTQVQAQSGNTDVLSVDAFLSVDKIEPGTTFKLGVEATLHNDWHINSHTPSEEFLIPTILEIDEVDGFQFGEINYPPGEEVKFAFSDTPLSVYESKAVFWLTVTAAGDFTSDEVILTGKLNYQACNDMTCLIPTNVPFAITVPVAESGEPVAPVNQDRFARQKEASELGRLAGDRSPTNEIESLISGKGLSVALLFIFLGGLALNLTPCVYPIIPITVSFFVGQSSGKVSHSFVLALVYVLGMCITYSALGVLAAMTGGLLGASLQNPIVLLVIAGVFLAFAASMFGAFEIRVPTFLNNLAGGSRQGVLGSLLMGLTVGIVAAPCIGPFVLSLLTYVAAKGNAFIGFLLFFVLSLGLGLPFLFLGTFSGSIKSLPRSGEWMVWVKKVFGVVMIAMAVYFLSTLIPDVLYVVLMAASLMVGGTYIGFVEKSKASFGWFSGIKKLIGLGLLMFGAWTATDAWLQANAPQIAWQKYDQSLIVSAKSEGKPVLIDFYADWCLPCKQIDRSIFGSDIVIKKSAGFVSLKADLTKESSDEVVSMRKNHNIVGVPTIILIDKAGREVQRFTDELIDFTPQEFADIMTSVEK